MDLLDHQDNGFSVILSDMCPSVSGIGSKDAALSSELGLKALRLAVGSRIKYAIADGCDGQFGLECCCDGEHGLLLPGGSLVIKLLEGEESQGMQFVFWFSLGVQQILHSARSDFVLLNRFS